MCSCYYNQENEDDSVDLSSLVISDDQLLLDDSPRGKLKTGYYLDKKIGTGKFGAVYKAIDCGAERKVAVKVVNLANEKDATLGFNEVEIYKLLSEGSERCPNIIEYYHSFIHHDERRLYMIMELGNLDLFTLLQAEPGKIPFHLTETVKIEIARQISKGVSFFHAKGIVHRDIKPENIIICRTGEVKICDLGFAVVYDEHDPPMEYLGTPDYLAPEIIKCSIPMNAAPYGFSVDLWALGITIYEIFSGLPLFYNADIKVSTLNILLYNDMIIYPQGRVPPMPVARLLKRLIKYWPSERKLDLDTLGPTPKQSPRDIFSSSE